jgi:putative flippase GtrA
MKSLLEDVLSRRETRFLLAGAGLAGFFFIVVFLLVTIGGLAPFASSVLAYFGALGLGYFVQRNWSFRGRHSHSKALPRYLMLQTGCAVLSGLGAQAATTYFRMPPLTMSIVNTFLMALISYVVSLNWVFPDDQRSK